MLGYYVDAEALKDIDGVKTQIAALEPGTSVMVDVKGIYGDFYYSSSVGEKRSTKIDPAKMDELIAKDEPGCMVRTIREALFDFKSER